MTPNLLSPVSLVLPAPSAVMISLKVIEDPNAISTQRRSRVKRYLYFWADGFSVDDGFFFTAQTTPQILVISL